MRVSFSLLETVAKYIGLVDSYAMKQPYELPSDAVRRSIDKKLHKMGFFLATWRNEGVSTLNSKVKSYHFAGTICRGHGRAVGDLWVQVSVPV